MVLSHFVNIRRRSLLALGVGGALLGLHGGAIAAQQCSLDAIKELAPKDATVTKVEQLAEPVPHCRIDGHVVTENPGPNQVNFRLQLPQENWAGRYYFIGMGGSAGYVPTDSQIPAGNPLVQGFAVAGTDTGRQGHMLDWGFLGEDEAKTVDHVHRGQHVTAQATQQITRGFYGVDSMYRYHSGCSGGGRMGMESMIRHPENFDGLLIGAPGGRSSMSMIAFIHVAQQMTREPGSWLSPQKLAMLDEKVTAQCDALDGAKDGIIWDHTACSYDFKQLQCESGDGPECLTAPEIRSVEAILAGPRGPSGKLMDGFPISNMSTWSGFVGPVPPPWSDEPSMQNMPKTSTAYVIASSLAKVIYGPDFDVLTDFDFNDQAMLDKWWAVTDQIEFGKPYSADLTGLQKAGNKVLLWNGVSDVCCLDTDIEQYVKEVADAVGGAQARDKFVRFYKVPGMAHCGGGTGPANAPDQLLAELIDWVEEGKSPGGVVTRRGNDAKLLFADPETGTVSGVMVPPSTGSNRDFLLCPWPQVATFNGEAGGEEDAANWSCQ